MKMVSIIIPHYNGWDNLAELLKSIPNDAQIEIIVVDDHSENASKKIKEFNERFPDVLFLKNKTEKNGAGSARNEGLLQATGKWLLFADADDRFSSNFWKILQPYFISEYDIVFFKPTSFQDGSNLIGKRHRQYEKFVTNYLESPTKINELNLRFNFVVPWSKLIRHSIVQKHNITFEEIMHSNDILFSAKVGYYAKKITAASSIIYEVRESGTSLTSSITESKFKIRFEAWLKYNSFLKKVLSEETYKLLDISTLPFISKVYENNLKPLNYFYVLKKSFQNRIPIIDSRFRNPKLIRELINDKKLKRKNENKN